jgi:dipeptidyl aminopeptidase/acylaminoacyl peptidase
MAQPFDTRTMKLAGDAITVPVSVIGAFGSGASGLMFTFSSSGTIAYTSNGTGRYQDVWYDRTGKMIGVAGDPADLGDVALSPDDSQAIYHNREGMDDLWTFDFARRVSTRFSTSPNRDHQAVWSPDGRQIIWGMQDGRRQLLFLKASNGTGPEEQLLPGDANSFMIPNAWSPDRRFLLYCDTQLPSGPAFNVGLGYDLLALPLKPDGTADGRPSVYIENQTGVGHARFSPNGRWVAYTLGNGEMENVFVSPFPMPPGRQERWAISSAGGYQPLWAADGKELFFISRDNKLTAVEVNTTSATFRSGAAKPLFNVQIAGGPPSAPTHRWDVTRDGQRFIVVTILDVTQSPPINVVTDWQSQLPR